MISQSAAWQALTKEHVTLKNQSLNSLFEQDIDRFKHFSCEAPYWLLDFSRTHVTESTIKKLCALADEAKLHEKIEAMFNGKHCNTSEDRAALHTALRDPAANGEIKNTLERMSVFCEDIYRHRMRGVSGEPITDVINIGIGGSDLGPRFVTQALTHYNKSNVRCHFISNIAPSDLSTTLKNLNPSSILFIVASKSFETQETLINAEVAKEWLTHMLGTEQSVQYQFAAVTAAPEKAEAFGINPEYIFPMWDFVGGRFSLWSSVGLPIALSIGFNNFKALLHGAHEMDLHFRNTRFENNLPLLMALIGIWYRNFWGVNNQAIIPYSTYLQYFPSFLKQLDMESNGKSVDHKGHTLDYATGPIVWGGIGTDSQHAFHQFLHQSAEKSMIDFIAFRHSLNPTYNQQAMLFSHCVAQAEALMQGRSLQATNNNPHQVMPGNHPSNLLLCEKLTPESLGALIALYEHKIVAQGAIWGINSFDQFGVELGKTLANRYLNAIMSKTPCDIGAIEWFKKGYKPTHSK